MIDSSGWQHVFGIVRNDDLEHIAALSDAEVTRGHGPGQVTLGMVAAESGANRVLRHLLTHVKIDADARSADGRTSLMYAVSAGNATGVQMLLDAGCEVDAQDAVGMSALMYLAWSRPPNALALSQQLIQFGASRKLVDVRGRTAAQIAETITRSVHPDDTISVYYPAGVEDPLIMLLSTDG